MEPPKNNPASSEHQDESAAPTIPNPTNMQIWRWKDDGGAIPPDPPPERTDEEKGES